MLASVLRIGLMLGLLTFTGSTTFASAALESAGERGGMTLLVEKADGILESFREGFCGLFCHNNCAGGGAWHETYNDDTGWHMGTLHGCAYTHVSGCGYHDCAPFASGELEELQTIIQELSLSGLAELDARNEKFSLNLTRQSAQVLGCDGKVVLSRRLTTQQLAGLTGATE